MNKNNSEACEIEPSSFKDPSARVFYKDGVVYRKIGKKYAETYRKFMNSGLYEKLISKGLIVPHEECGEVLSGVESSGVLNDGAEIEDEIIIKPKEVFVSYPYEWCFSEFKDAALATLEIQKIALEFDMTLKDATPFNIQFLENRPVLIDTSSFEDFKERPWAAYRQFCENFLCPLCLIAYKDLRLQNLLLGNINGIPLDLTSKLLPNKTKFNPNLLAHIHIHSKMQNKYSDNKVKTADVKVSKQSLLNIVNNLYDTVTNINLSKYKTEWDEYYSNTNYTEDGFEAKKEIINGFRERLLPEKVWDFGANTGVFSRIFSAKGAEVKAFDIDPLAIEKNYLEAKACGEKNIFPLIFDIVNPTPALGFDNKERKTLNARAKDVDLVLALALMHHLRITYNVPFAFQAKYFAEFSKHLIIEFVQKDDSKVQNMLLNREDIFDDYTKEGFEAAFGGFYKILETKQIPGTRRILYLMERN